MEKIYAIVVFGKKQLKTTLKGAGIQLSSKYSLMFTKDSAFGKDFGKLLIKHKYLKVRK